MNARATDKGLRRVTLVKSESGFGAKGGSTGRLPVRSRLPGALAIGSFVLLTAVTGCGNKQEEPEEAPRPRPSASSPGSGTSVPSARADAAASAEPSASSGRDAGVNSDAASPTASASGETDSGAPPQPLPDAGGSFGDIGTECNPSADPTQCHALCLELSSGGGVCIDLCGAERSCPADFACNTVPLEGQLYDICLPNASCGELDYRGECAGDILRYCGTEGPVEVTCSDVDPSLTCALVDPDIGYDCIASGFSGGCSGETEKGRCENDTVVRCTSQATGGIERIDCANQGLVCGIGPGGIAACQTPGTTGCGNVTYQGECLGSVLRYCNGGSLYTNDCSSGGSCQWVSDEQGFDCVATPSGGALEVHGVIGYEKKAPTTSGLGASTPVAAPNVLVRVRSYSDGAEVGRAYTAEDGSFQVTFDASEDVFVDVNTVGDPSVYPMSVRDCPELDCDSDAAYTVATPPFTPDASVDLGTLVIGVDQGAGAFNIFAQYVAGVDFARANFKQEVPPFTVRWERGSSTACDTSCFVASLATILVNGPLEDTDEFDDSVLLHEFGHFVENAFSRSDSPGGYHDGSPTDPRLAWGEGYGTFVGARIAQTPLYIDTGAAGASVIDVRSAGNQVPANPNDIRGMNQLVSELLVSQFLWSLDAGVTNSTSAHGSEPIFDVLANYFPSPDRFADRGLGGVELVDFLDGWFCRGHGSEADVRFLLQGLGFPYDFAQLPACD